MADKRTVFISYSQRDKKWRDRLLGQLRVLQLDEYELWEDTQIGVGEDWLAAIQTAIDRAAVVIFLVSSDFLTSDFIKQKEIPEFLERRGKGQLRIYPILVEPCAFQQVPWLAAIQMRPRGAIPLSTKTRSKWAAELTSIVTEIAGWLAPAKQDS